MNDSKNFHYFCYKNEIFKVHTSNLQESVVKQMRQQIENEEVVVRLVDCSRYCVKQEDNPQIMKTQQYSLKKSLRKRVRSHLLQLFDTTLDDVDCDPLPYKKRKYSNKSNKSKDKQLCYAIVDILDDLNYEDAIIKPKLENFDDYQKETITIIETDNLIDFKCVKKFNKPLILRAMTNCRQIKKEVVDFSGRIPENIHNNNENEAVINQRLPVETLTTTTETTINTIVDKNNNNDRISDYILIIYEYLRDYLQILYQINVLNRHFSQIFKQRTTCEFTKDLVQMLNKVRCILGEEFIKYLIRQLQTFKIDDIFNKLLELLKKDGINIEAYKFFYHIYQLLKPHKEFIYSVHLLKRIYDEIEKFLNENDNKRINQQQEYASQSRCATQGLLNQQQQQENVVNQPQYVAQSLLNQQQQQQESGLNQERPATRISLSQQQVNSLNQQRSVAQTSLNQQKQQENALNQQISVIQAPLSHQKLLHQEQQGVLNQQQKQQDNALCQQIFATQTLLSYHQMLQQQQNTLNEQRSTTQTLLNQQQQQPKQQESALNEQRSAIQTLSNQQQKQQENAFNLRKSASRTPLSQQQLNNTFNKRRSPTQTLLNQQEQQKQQQNVLNEQRSATQTLLNQQQQQQQNALNQQHQQQQQQQKQKENAFNPQRSASRTPLSQQQQDNILTKQISPTQRLLNQQEQQQDALNMQKSSTRTSLNSQLLQQQQQQQNKALNQQRSVIQAPLSHQKLQYQQQQESLLNLQISITQSSLLKQQQQQQQQQQLENQLKPFSQTFLSFCQPQGSLLHQTRSVTRQQQQGKPVESLSNQLNSGVVQQTTSNHLKQQQKTKSHTKSNYEKQQHSSNNPINLSYSTNCFVPALSNRQLKPQSQPQVETPIIFTQIQLAILEKQIKDYHKLAAVTLKQLLMKNNNQPLENTTKLQHNQPPSVVTTSSSSTHQFVNNLGNIIRKVDGNIPNSNHNRSIKLNGQSSKFNNSISKNTLDISTLSKQTNVSVLDLPPTQQQQQQKQPTVLPESSQISTTTVLTSSTTSVKENLKSLPTISLSDSLFSSIPPPVPATTENTTFLPMLTIITTPTTTILTPTTATTILTSSQSAPIVTTKTEQSELSEIVDNSIIEVVEKDDAVSESVSSSILSNIETKQESPSRSSTPIPSALLEAENNESIKLLQAFEIKTEDSKEMGNLNYEYDTSGNDTIMKLDEYINIDDLGKPIKIESNIGGASPTDSGLGSPFDIEMADLLHSNNNNDIHDIQTISDNIISGQNEESSICLCGKKAIYLCACNYSMYCSETCRLIDWKCHQSLCLRTIR